MKKSVQELVRITPDNQKLFSHCIPDAYKGRLFHKDVSAIGALTPDGQGCGAVVACLEEGNIRILSVYVEPEYRREGMGSRLLKSIQKIMSQAGKRKMRLFVEYPYPKMQEMEQVLLRNGFSVASEANRIYYVPIRHLGDLELLKKPASTPKGAVISMKEMTMEQKARWLRRFGRDLPAELSPQNAGGILLEEDTFVYLWDGQVKAFAICSHLEDGSVYLAALYGGEQGAREMIPVLQKTLSSMSDKYPSRILCFSAATDAGKKLAEKLCQGHEDKIELQTMRTSIWTWKDEEEPVEYDPYSLTNLMPRLNGLGAVLSDLGIETCEMSADSETYPAIRADIDGETLSFAYIPMGPVEEERFMLNLTAVVLERQEAGPEQMILCQFFNLRNHFATAIYDADRGQVLLRHMLPELNGSITGETLDMAVRLFMDSIRQFRSQEL